MLKTINKLTKERLAKGGPGSGRYPKGSSEQKEPAPANAENCPSDMLKAFIVQVKDLVDKETSGHSAVAKTSIIDSD